MEDKISLSPFPSSALRPSTDNTVAHCCDSISKPALVLKYVCSKGIVVT